MSELAPIRVAVVGSGPAGFYAAGHLLKDSAGAVEVDMLERLPTPWGLVRSGVAPDHPKIKSVSRVYEKTAEHPNFRFFGNVEIGRDLTHGQLLSAYHAVIYAIGTSGDRRLGIPGEDLLAHYHAIVYATGSAIDRPLGIPGEELAGSHACLLYTSPSPRDRG